MKCILPIVCLACFVVGCEGHLRIESKPINSPDAKSVVGIVEKVEWLENDSDEVVILFRDGRYIKFRGPIGNDPVTFRYGKEHAIMLDDFGRIIKMEVIEKEPEGPALWN